MSLPKYILSLDTSGGSASACVYDVQGEVSLSDCYEAIPMSQGEYILPMIDDVLQQSGLKRRDIDAVGVCRGPGFFTGMRVGLSTAKGLSYGLGVELYGVSSLQAYAHLSGVSDDIVIMQETKRSDIYIQQFSNFKPVSEIKSLLSSDIIIPENSKLVGSACNRYINETNTDFEIIETVEFPTAKSVAMAIVANLKDGIDCPSDPLYLRSPDVKMAKKKPTQK